MSQKKIISVITPCFNEEDNVEACYRAVKAIFEERLSNYEYEHIFCDNASTDRTVSLLKNLAPGDPRLKIIVNSRNYGPFRSTFNGLMHASGDAVVVQLATDLQDPPELIEGFVGKWEEGYRVVYGIRKKREESVLMRAARGIFYRTVNRFADFYVPPDVGEFQLIDRVVVEALRKCEDYYPYLRGMIANCGYESVGMEYVWKARKRGLSKNGIYNLIDQGLNGLISFTNVPLRICMLAGFALSTLSILYAFVQLLINVVWFRRFAPPGIATLIVGFFFFSGIQLMFLGILGEYVSAIHFQVRKRPLVIVKEKINFDDREKGDVAARGVRG